MIENNRNKVKTDEAWNRLYMRLERDQLLATRSRRRKGVVLWSGVAAAVLVGVICLISVFKVETQKGDANLSFVMKQNTETSTLVTTLEDGTVVYLTQASTLKYPEHFEPDRRVVDFKGEAFFDIARKATQTFFIDTEKVKVEVLGTAFSIRATGNSPFNLAVQRGKVRVTLKQSGEVSYVTAGEEVNLLSGRLLLSKSERNILERYTMNIRFKDESLEDILRVINGRDSEEQLQLASKALGKRKLTVEFDDNSTESAAQLICVALSLKCNRQGDKLVLSE